jgi:hypothetical protein
MMAMLGQKGSHQAREEIVSDISSIKLETSPLFVRLRTILDKLVCQKWYRKVSNAPCPTFSAHCSSARHSCSSCPMQWHAGDEWSERRLEQLPEVVYMRLVQMPQAWAHHALSLASMHAEWVCPESDPAAWARSSLAVAKLESAMHAWAPLLPPPPLFDSRECQWPLRCVRLAPYDSTALTGGHRLGPLNKTTYRSDGTEGSVEGLHADELVVAISYARRAFLLRRDWIDRLWELHKSLPPQDGWAELKVPISRELRPLQIFEFMLEGMGWTRSPRVDTSPAPMPVAVNRHTTPLKRMATHTEPCARTELKHVRLRLRSDGCRSHKQPAPKYQDAIDAADESSSEGTHPICSAPDA